MFVQWFVISALADTGVSPQSLCCLGSLTRELPAPRAHKELVLWYRVFTGFSFQVEKSYGKTGRQRAGYDYQMSIILYGN